MAPNPSGPKAMLKMVFVTILCVVGFFMCFGLWENLPADRIMVIQNPITGKLAVHVTPGPKIQMWGKVTKYIKRDIYEFETPVRFNDGGHGKMIGSVQYELPLAVEMIRELHQKFGTQKAVEDHLISTVVNKAIYMTGPLMSSKESYAEKRNYLISYVEDQIQNGTFKTVSEEKKTTDPMTGAEKNITVVNIVKDENGNFARQETSTLTIFGIKTFNFAISSLPYDEAVEAQIKQQQQITMDVQTAIAAAKKAEQNAITVAKEGEASAAKAKWDQEVIKAQQVTEAEQKKEVAKLEKEAAEFTKQKLILEGEGEAAKKRLVMSADGALEKKLATYEAVNGMWAEAFSKFQGDIVPTIQSGSESSNTNGATQFMQMMGMKAAKDLALDMSTRKQ